MLNGPYWLRREWKEIHDRRDRIKNKTLLSPTFDISVLVQVLPAPPLMSELLATESSFIHITYIAVVLMNI